jgi:uncharacterized membrane protein YjgN (DUF898 family)
METQQTQETTKLIPFQFNGKAGEYFSIWIANIFLSIITLGIYSAWAKVRRNRYFYANTFLLDSPFEYLADPVKILKGRLIVFALFCLYYIPTKIFAGTFPPFVLLILAVFFLLVIVILPWILVKSFAFRARNSSYRNIRFRFRARYFEAMGIFVGLPLLSLLTLGILYPYYVYRKNRFIINNSNYGQRAFVLSVTSEGFYKIYLSSIGVFLLCNLIAIFFMLPLLALFGSSIVIPIIYLSPLVYFPYLKAYISASVINLVWSNVSFGNNRLVCSLRAWNIFWIMITNALIIVLTFGLMIPWAKIRIMRYRLTHLKLITADDLNSFIAGEQEKVSAVGEEISDFFDMADFFDVDFDIGV